MKGEVCNPETDAPEALPPGPSRELFTRLDDLSSRRIALNRIRALLWCGVALGAGLLSVAWVDLLADRNDEGVGGWLGDSVRVALDG